MLFVRLSKRFSRRGLYDFLAREFARIAAGARVLSIGAGGEVNRLLHRCAQGGKFKVASFDIDPAQGPDLVGDICTHDFGSARYDVVVMSEVLEHTHAPHLALQNVHHVLAPGGTLILTVPFALPIHDAPGDYFRFTRHGLTHLLHAFEHVDIRERNSYFHAIDVLQVRLIHADARTTRWLSYVLITLMILKWPITEMLGRFFRSDALTTGYLVSARKPA